MAERWQKIRTGALAFGIAMSLQRDGRQTPSYTAEHNVKPNNTLDLSHDASIYQNLAIYSAKQLLTSLENPSLDKSEQELPYSTSIIIAPGIGGGKPIFTQAITEKTEPLGIKLYYAEPPNPGDPHVDAYIKTIRDQALAAVSRNEDIYLVGYSHGARATLLFLDSLVALDTDENLMLRKHIKNISLIASRDNEKTNNNNYPQLINYPEYYIDNETNQKKISDARLQAIHDAFSIDVYYEDNDKVVPNSQTIHLGEELHVPIIRVTVPGNHFGDKNSGYPIAAHIVTRYKATESARKISEFITKKKTSKKKLLLTQARKPLQSPIDTLSDLRFFVNSRHNELRGYDAA